MKTIEEMEIFAKENFIPIARKDFIIFLKDLIIKRKYHNILEIGSAIGYTAISLALLDDVYVTTIEHDLQRYQQCMTNITDFSLNSKINAIYDDALKVSLSSKYDVIFIDAAKAKNILFFEKFQNNLEDNGVIIIDNMNLNDFKKVASLKKIAFYETKIFELKEYLNNLKNFKVSYLDIGDGIAFIEKV